MKSLLLNLLLNLATLKMYLNKEIACVASLAKSCSVSRELKKNCKNPLSGPLSASDTMKTVAQLLIFQYQ